MIYEIYFDNDIIKHPDQEDKGKVIKVLKEFTKRLYRKTDVINNREIGQNWD